MGLEVNNNDIDELAEEDSQELITEELIKLHCVSQQEVVEEFFNVGLRSSHWGLRKDYDSHPKTPQKTIYGRSSISRVECLRKRIWEEIDEHCTKHFVKDFSENEFGHVCNVCVILHFLKDVTSVSKNERFLSILRAQFPDKDVQAFSLCGSCKRSPYNSKIPPLSRNIGFIYLDPPDLPSLDPISERLISPRLPFIQIRRLRAEGYAVVGQLINVPVDVNTMVQYSFHEEAF
ncbi:hypothetical protein AVEN_83246-1 [Araneus ventricosus]|uniref:DUF6570 domain-containing protein n=1 Tax=Araneus ventricosus TaxID=182803 RepID=A0A4Y2RH55_ARAVE|nr:hypothetical protein AVEN_83246-1 [Araneus ventricosus]